MNKLYAFQIVAGFDDLLGYCSSLEQAKAEAEEHRQEIERGVEEDGETETVPPIAIYEVRLKEPTVDLLLPVLNERRTLTDVLVER